VEKSAKSSKNIVFHNFIIILTTRVWVLHFNVWRTVQYLQKVLGTGIKMKVLASMYDTLLSHVEAERTACISNCCIP
jgi:hypothetical protein